MVFILDQQKKNLEKKKLKKLFRGKVGKVGDIILIQYENKLGYWKMRQYVGRCIGIRSGKNGFRYKLRNIINGTGIDFSFDASSHIFLSAKIISDIRFVNFRQSKLYFLKTSQLSLTRLEKLA